MIFTLDNPSDAYTFETDDLDVATVVVLSTSNGQHGATQVDGDFKVPVFLMCSQSDVDDWSRTNFSVDYKALADRVFVEKRDAVIRCLDSILVGGADDREIFNAAVADMTKTKRKAFHDMWDDKKRSSMSNIGSRWRKIATRLREDSKTSNAEPTTEGSLDA